LSEEEVCLEEALCDLESIVDELEGGKKSLEESLELYERGMRLVRICQARLERAERKIESLTGEIPRDLDWEGNKA